MNYRGLLGFSRIGYARFRDFPSTTSPGLPWPGLAHKQGEQADEQASKETSSALHETSPPTQTPSESKKS